MVQGRLGFACGGLLAWFLLSSITCGLLHNLPTRAATPPALTPPGTAAARGASGGLGALARSGPVARLRLRLSALSSAAGQQQLALGHEEGPVPVEERDFIVNGWRWHSKAALRELRRLRLAVSKNASAVATAPERGASVTEGYDFVWSFMYRKLHMVEGDVFFPWLRAELPPHAIPVLDELEREREAVRRVGMRLGQVVRQATRSPSGAGGRSRGRGGLLSGGGSADGDGDLSVMKSAISMMEQLERMADSLQRRQEAFLMPLVAAYVPVRRQQKFNQKVIASLGIVDAQTLLVSMRDAIGDDVGELSRFRKEVPRAAQAMLPALRATFYAPKQKGIGELEKEMAGGR